MRRILLAALLLSGACTTRRTIGQPSFAVHDEPIRVDAYAKADILFMVDNSPSMAPKQTELRRRFPELLQQIQATQGLNASYHIGVVTSDLGAGPYELDRGQCHPDGDGGKLRTRPSPTAVSVDAACSRFTLANGASFIDLDALSGTSNVEGTDVATAFSCLASVGDIGCGFEHPLESVYRALATPSVNPGFLRDDALLVIVFVTDEDDCSAPPDSDLFDPSPAGIGLYGPLHSYRCTQFGISCDGKPLGAQPVDGSACTPTPTRTADGGKLLDLARYTTLFSAPRSHGGLKDDPADVIVASVAAPPAPFGSTLTTPCGDQASNPSCVLLSHSCVATDDPRFFGDPAVRLDAVVRAAPSHIATSICDTDYSPLMGQLVTQMASRMAPGCLPGGVVDLADPGCQVDIGDTVVTRCGDGHLPCWGLQDDASCALQPTPNGSLQHLRLTVQGRPPGLPIRAMCPLYLPSL